jgi:polyisoprenoid-binding protein YceI
MYRRPLIFAGALALLLLVFASPARAQKYGIDPAHSSITFKVKHLGLTWVYGRFNEFSGDFTFDKGDPGKSSFAVTIKTDSIDTNQKMRDKHLRSKDFFDVEKYPEITFKTTSVKKGKDGYELTGDFTMRGVAKPITFTVKGGDDEKEFPKGVKRIGFTIQTKLNRSDWGMNFMVGPISDAVHIAIGFEGVQKK